MWPSTLLGMNGLRGAHKFLLAGAAALLALGAGCSSGSIDPATQSEPAEHLEFDSVPSAVEMVASTRALGLSVLADHANDTIVTSPASTVIALSMLGSVVWCSRCHRGPRFCFS